MITFGKHAGATWTGVANRHPNYFEWALAKLDLTRFAGPTEYECQAWLRVEGSTHRGKMVVRDYLDRVAKLEEAGTKVKESTEETSPEKLTLDSIPAIRRFDFPSQENNIAAFEEACYDTYGRFPFPNYLGRT